MEQGFEDWWNSVDFYIDVHPEVVAKEAAKVAWDHKQERVDNLIKIIQELNHEIEVFEEEGLNI